MHWPTWSPKTATTSRAWMISNEVCDGDRKYVPGLKVPVNESFKNIINNAIKEYASKTVNVEFIDRNVAIALADNTYRVRIDDKPLFEDDNHLTYYGSYVMGQAILKQLIDGK